MLHKAVAGRNGQNIVDAILKLMEEERDWRVWKAQERQFIQNTYSSG